MNTKQKYLSLCEDKSPNGEIHLPEGVIIVIDHETYRMPDGSICETHSRPSEPAPDGKFDSKEFGWHDVLCKWVKLSDIDKPRLAKLGDDGSATEIKE